MRTSSPENVFDLINLDCINEENPSNTTCTESWYYWYQEEGTGKPGDWKVDASAKFVCKGIRTSNAKHSTASFSLLC